MSARKSVIAMAGVALLALSAPAAAQELEVRYQVRRGDTLYELAERYFTRLADYTTVQRLNRVRDPRRLPAGSTLRIPERLLRTEPVAAKVAAFRGDVALSGPQGEMTPRIGLAVLEGARLTTGANAFLTIELADGSRVTLPSRSQLTVTRLRRTLLTGAVRREFDVGRGRSRSVVTPAKRPNDRFIIRTPLTVAAVRGTEFRVNHDQDAARSSVEVLEGTVGAAPAEGPNAVVLPAGSGAQATAQGVGQPQPLLDPPSVERRNLLQDDPLLRFRVSGPQGATAHRVQIAADAGFIDLIAEAQGESDGEIALPSLPNGVYFARFTAIDSAGLEGVPAAFAVERRLNAVELDPPVAGARRQYLFRWRSEGEGVAVYRFVLSRMEDASEPLIDIPGLDQDSVAVTDLPRGVYFWRVLVTRFENDRRFEKWTPVQRFEIGR